jgi:phospholipid/cholesterol/gamma-HCH transport system permease protein
MVIEEADEVNRLACREVRGGNRLAAFSAELPGLTGWVSCHPLQPSPRGGDVYYMSACSRSVMARVVLADVAGHGDAVADAAGRLRDALRRNVERWDQSTLIRQLNDNFLKGAESARFATAFVASFYSNSGELLFTNAGHVPPLWYRAAAREWSLLLESTPLGKEIVDLPLGLIAGTSYKPLAAPGEGVRVVRAEPRGSGSVSAHPRDSGLSGLSNRAGGIRDVVMEWVGNVGAATGRTIAYVGGPAEISARSLRLLFLSPLKRGRMLHRAIHEAMAAGVGAIPITSLITFFVGVIIALQGAYELQRLGAMQLVSPLVAIAITRELGPLITAIVVIGRSGSAFAAQIGTMRVTEELDALETMALDPVAFLVVPKFLAMAIMLPCLAIWADLMGVLGGSLFGVIGGGYTFGGYMLATRDALLLRDIASGVVKSLVFGVVITAGVGGSLRSAP